MKKNAIILLAILAGMLLAFFSNYALLEPLIIPDPCYYHSRDTTFIFELFYSLKAADGHHPFPTLFNLLFTLFIGGFAGLLILSIARRGIRK